MPEARYRQVELPGGALSYCGKISQAKFADDAPLKQSSHAMSRETSVIRAS